MKNNGFGTIANLLLELQRLAKEEKSNYAKILFQENIIHFYILVALESIESHYNNKTSAFKFINKEKILRVNPVKIEFDTKEAGRKTLGALCGLFSSFLGNGKELETDLRKFIKLRNNITHKMLYRYKSFTELEKDSLASVKLGEEVIKQLEKFIDEIF